MVILAPGLGAVVRGTERFFLELAAELRKAGVDATCWGTSSAPGVESLAAPGRLELQALALNHCRADAGLAGVQPAAVYDWSIYAEDHLFAIPAGQRIRELLKSGERLLVYARWQGGLVDPSGAPTELLKTMASAREAGQGRLAVYTDYVYAPIDALLYSAGAALHTLGPWLTEPIQQIGIPEDATLELPMCIQAQTYRNCREGRMEGRRAAGIPEDTFVVLSVGAFDTSTPDKRHGHMLREILALPQHERVWWVVAGSRGPAPCAWEEEARRAMGERFVPLTNVAFDKMAQVYGMADIFALASVDETFGLVYLEAQAARLPVVAHESPVTRHLCGEISAERRRMSLVDMRRAGAAASAMEQWRGQLAAGGDGAGEAASARAGCDARAWLETYAEAQERRFGWEFVGPRYAEAFRKLMEPEPGRAGRGVRKGVTWDEQNHVKALRLFEKGNYRDALVLLGRAIGAQENAERWNDWATIQVALEHAHEAEAGFRRALAIHPAHAQAAVNLGTLLATTGRAAEAIPLLEEGSAGVDEGQREAVRKVLAHCRAKANSRRPASETELSAYVRDLAKPGDDEYRLDEKLQYYAAAVNALPDAGAGARLLGIGPAAAYLAPAFARWKGYREIWWNADDETLKERVRRATSANVQTDVAFEIKAFEVEQSPWPYEDEQFDVIFCGETLERLSADPMATFCEINRVLKRGGQVVMTAPNLASAKGLQTTLTGQSAYVDGRFVGGAGLEAGQAARGGHREYTASEIERMAQAAGFKVEQLRTQDVYWDTPTKIFTALVASGYPIGHRGDTIFLAARKESAVRERFPAKFYDLGAASEDGERPLRILVAHENPPRPDQGGAEYRFMQMLREMRSQGHDVTYLAPRGYQKERYAPALAALGIECYFDDAEVLRREGFEVNPEWTLQQVLREGQFDLVLFYLWFWMSVSVPEHYLDEVRRISPRTRIAVLTDDCHGLREMRGAKLSGRWSDQERAGDYLERELEIFRRSDIVVAVSNDDRKRLLREAPQLEIGLLSNVVEAGPTGPEFDARGGLMYLADYNNPASRDGVEWYLKEVAPIVRAKLPDVKVYLTGAGMTPDLAAGDEGTVRVGFVPELATELAKHRILISPVRYGTGTKTKNLHALAHGVPIITTSIGAEGMDLKNGRTALIADSAEEFARAVVKLYTDRALWKRLSEEGRSHILEQFPHTRMAGQVREMLERARQMTAQRRDEEHVWSARAIENYFPEIVTHQPAPERPALRILAYVQAAEKLAAMGDRAGARRQLRHVFSFVPQRMAREVFFGDFAPVAQRMEKVYRELGETQGAAEFHREAGRFNPTAFPQEITPERFTPQHPAPVVRGQMKGKKAKGSVEVSVVIPTFNRRETLAECLDALSRQSLAARRFEAIVVDDGSSDGTAELCRQFKAPYRLQYLRQKNAGAGAARRAGAERACGRYVLLFNDDTIAEPDLLAIHLRNHAEHGQEKLAVLGDFQLPAAARERALTHYLSKHPLLFPQVTLERGVHSKNAFFIASNLSVRRDAVLAAGSFDARFRVAEDTELGVRLRQRGYSVLYVPEAKAIHQHLAFTMGDLICRAQIYGRTQLMLLRKHPQLLGEGTGPFGRLEEGDIEKIRADVARRRSEVQDAARALERFDEMDFRPYHERRNGERTAADEVMTLFDAAVPAVFWFHLFEGFLEAWDGEQQRGRRPVQQAPLQEAEARV